MKPLFGDLFKGMLGLFLLDMGLVAGRRLKELKKVGIFLTLFAVLIPLINACLSVALAYLFHLSNGDAFMFAILCASASYIAVPAAIRIAIPEANPSFYVTPSLGITFPFNIAIGIPLYYTIIDKLWP
jgi:hypothetical protein